MPQMMPMNWMTLCMYMMFIFAMTFIVLSFLSWPRIKKNISKKKEIMKKKFKWFW